MATNIGRAFVTILPDLSKFGATTMAGIKAQGTAAAGAAGMSVGKAFVAGAAGLAVVGGLAVALGSDFQDSFKTIRVGTGATGEALEDLKDTFKNVVASTSADTGTIASVVADLSTRLDLTGAPLESLSKQIIDLAEITGGDAVGSVESITRWFGDWGIATEQQESALDGLFRASQATGPSVERLAELSVKFGAPMRQFGFTVEEAAVTLGKFEKEGVNTELVMGSMRQALAKFAEAGREPKQAFAETVEAIKAMPNEADRVTAAMELFGKRAGPDMAAAIYEGRFEIGELFDTVSNGTDTIGALQDETQSIGSTLSEFGNKIKTAVEPAATKLFEAVRTAVQSSGPVVEAFGNVVNTIATALAAVPGPVYLVVGAIATFIAAFAATVKTIAIFKAVWTGLTALMAANPIVLILMLIVGAVYLLWRNWDTVVRWLGNAWEWLGGVFSTVWGAIAGFLEGLGGILYDWVVAPIVWVFNLWLSYWHMIFDTVAWVWNMITGIIVGAWNLITGAIGGAVNWITDTVRAAWNGLVTIITTVGEFIKTAASGAFDWILDKVRAIRDVAGKIGEKFTTAFTSVVDAVGRGKDAVVGFVQAMWDKLREFINWAKDNAQKVTGPIGKAVEKSVDWASSAWSGVRSSLGFADGGRVRPSMGPVWVGEEGPELVTFERAGHVTPSAESMQMASRGGGGVTVAGPLLAITGDVSIRSDQDIVELSRQLARDVNTRARAAGDARPLTGATA
jgi:TP901 family phage tail tape measure protein